MLAQAGQRRPWARSTDLQPFSESESGGRTVGECVRATSAARSVGSGHRHRASIALAREKTVQTILVVEEVRPLFVLERRGGGGDSQTFMASSESVGELHDALSLRRLPLVLKPGDEAARCPSKEAGTGLGDVPPAIPGWNH